MTNENPEAKKHTFIMSIKLHPVKCPHCGRLVELNQTIYPSIIPGGKTKALYKAKKNPTVKPAQATLEESENY